MGITGITKDTNMDNYLHFCHTSLAEENNGEAQRVENFVTNMKSYTIIVTDVSTSSTNPNRKLPEIMDWSVDYGGTMDPEDDISFRIWPGSGLSELYPCGHPKFAD